jgi:hypothetical protein
MRSTEPTLFERSVEMAVLSKAFSLVGGPAVWLKMCPHGQQDQCTAGRFAARVEKSTCLRLQGE